MKVIEKISKFAVICMVMSLTSCATIIGGAKYEAEVIVDNHPKAEITYNGKYIGSGRANVKIKRRNADKVVFTVQEKGKQPQQFAFQERSFRGWSFVGTVLLWTGYSNGILLPWGILVDGITGAWWKPDDDEPGVVKVHQDKFRYFLRYDSEADNSPESAGSIEQKLEQINSLKARGVISDEEYNRMRSNLLDNI